MEGFVDWWKCAAELTTVWLRRESEVLEKLPQLHVKRNRDPFEHPHSNLFLASFKF
jgi:hypothetical protein